MNDLYNATLSRPRLFVDDTCLMVSEKSISLLEQSCNSELHRLKKWCVANKLQINPDKSVLIYIPFKLNDSLLKLNIAYNDVLVPSNNSSKYLGINIDSKLNFQPHLKMIENKLARSVGILSKVRFLFPTSTLLLLYFALIHPHLLFGIVLWGSTCSSYQSKLQILQNKAIRIISNCNRRTLITPFYHKLGILKIPELYKFEIAKLMHQHSKQNLPPAISNLFKPLSNIHNRITRSVSLNHIYVEKFSTLRCQRSIKYQGAKIWNAIPLELRDQSYKNFKLNYKKILLERYQICT